MNVSSALRTDRMCKALTGLSVSEFKQLSLDFAWNYHEYEVKRKPDRVRKLGGGREAYLEEVEEKLFYILWYMKTYPTFDLASFNVGFARSKAHKWVYLLLPILETAMKRKLSLPQRRISDPEEFFRLYPEAREVFADGIERSIQRSKKRNNRKTTRVRRKCTPESQWSSLIKTGKSWF